jgi:hydroxyacyl-ACP dehydratase HTD2-like protein with hotdog domain
MSCPSLPVLLKGPYTSSHIVRWCAAQQNWDKIHYDESFARRAGLPERLINGGMKQHLLVQFLEQAFPGCWITRLDFRFAAPDLVGHSLEVCGETLERSRAEGCEVARVSLAIRNVDGDHVSTRGEATIELASRGTGHLRSSALPADRCRLDWAAEAPADLQQRFGLALGETLETVVSDYPIDLSRLRLFADAIGDLDPCYYDQDAAHRQGLSTVVAPPLFPIHAIELKPGTRSLSADPNALGREGVSEVGRYQPGLRLGLPGEGIVNGGSRLRLYSLASVGETVAADSRLASVKERPGAGSGPLLVIECLDTYRTTSGRLLLEELITIVYRNTRLPSEGLRFAPAAAGAAASVPAAPAPPLGAAA